MKTLLRVVAPALLSLGALQAQPRINSLLNNASYTVPPLPGSAIAQGSIFAVFGENMGPAALVQAGFPLPTDLSGTSLRVSASGNNVSAFIIYTSAKQLAAVLPSDTPLGPALATVTYNSQTSATFSFTVVKSSPGLFTLNGGGTGPAVLTTPDFRVITYTNAATDNDVLSAWATGITPLSGRADNTAAEFFDPPLEVEVFAGGKKANVRYRGRAPGLAGLDQIVFDLPAGLRGCSIPLAVRVGGVISNYSTLAVAGSNRICSDASGLSESDTAKAIQNGLRVGSIALTRIRTKVTASGFTATSSIDAAGADFTRFSADSFVRSQGGGGSTVSLGYCVVYTFSGSSAPGDPYAATKLDAGPQLTLTGPTGSKPIARTSAGSYSADLGTSTAIPGITLPPGVTLPGSGPGFLDPGTYTVTGPGGADVGAFTARLTVPQPLSTNLDSINVVSRGAALNVTWTGGGSNEYVTVTGVSTRTNPTVGAAFTCTERASVGRLQVPAEVLLALPPSQTTAGTPTGFLSVGTAPLTDANRFTASGLDVGYILYTSADSKNLAYE
jgi:uncharacterized protein (TIGR03437 family)